MNHLFITTVTYGGPQLSRQNKVTALQSLLTAKQSLLTAKQTQGKTKKTSWSAVVIYVRDGKSCNSNTLLARKTAIFRAHDVLLRVWFVSLLSLRCAIPSCIPHMIQVHG